MAKKKAKKTTRKPNRKTFLIAQLRRLSFKWKPRGEVLKAARISRGVYECNICKGQFGNKEIVMDHIDPVVDVKHGWVDWNTFIESLFCYEEGWQVICKSCHDIKTEKENKERLKAKKG